MTTTVIRATRKDKCVRRKPPHARLISTPRRLPRLHSPAMRLPVALTLLFVAGTRATAAAPADKADFNRDIRPILSETCFLCHGPDKNQRKAELRLDQKDGLFATKDDGRVVVPGKPGESQLFARITSSDPEMRMPPADSGRKLSDRQIELIRRWIKQGAEWKGHWAYVPPTRPAVPNAGHVGVGHVGNVPHVEPVSYVLGSIRNPVDAFIVSALREQGLS